MESFISVLGDVEMAIFPEPVAFNIFVTELVTNNGWKVEDVKRISDILKRDRVIFEPRPGYIKMNHGGN